MALTVTGSAVAPGGAYIGLDNLSVDELAAVPVLPVLQVAPALVGGRTVARLRARPPEGGLFTYPEHAGRGGLGLASARASPRDAGSRGRVGRRRLAGAPRAARGAARAPSGRAGALKVAQVLVRVVVEAEVALARFALGVDQERHHDVLDLAVAGAPCRRRRPGAPPSTTRGLAGEERPASRDRRRAPARSRAARRACRARGRG